MHDTDESIKLGKKIATARINKNLSLRQLAKMINVTPSLLSQIERGVANPSLNTLRMIAIALDVSLFSLFIEQANADNLITRADNRKRIIFPHNTGEYVLLSPNLNGAIEMIMMNIPPQSQSAPVPLPHQGEEVAYVMSGTVTLFLGDIIETLYQGDSVKIPPGLPHKWENRSDSAVTLIFAVTPPTF